MWRGRKCPHLSTSPRRVRPCRSLQPRRRLPAQPRRANRRQRVKRRREPTGLRHPNYRIHRPISKRAPWRRCPIHPLPLRTRTILLRSELCRFKRPRRLVLRLQHRRSTQPMPRHRPPRCRDRPQRRDRPTMRLRVAPRARPITQSPGPTRIRRARRASPHRA